MTIEVYIVLLVAGLFMLGLETIVPGGVLGVIGVVALIIAAVIGFSIFPAPWGMMNALGILILTGITLYIWVKYFPKTIAGKILTLSEDTKTYKANIVHDELVGKEGVAATTLRPAGIAKIDGNRVDVVAEGRWIEQDAPIKVVSVSGHIITVRQTAEV